MNAGAISGIRDAGSTASPEKNPNSKKGNKKTGFSTYNIVSANADVDTSVSTGDTYATNEKVSNNINKTNIGQSDRVGGANKSWCGKTNKGKIRETNIKARAGLNRADNSRFGRANIKTGKKAGAGNVIDIDNSIDGSNKISD